MDENPRQESITYVIHVATFSTLLDRLISGERFKCPRPQRGDANRRDKSRYCEYHKDVEHRTNECYWLWRLLNFLAKRGHLQEYIKKTTPTNSRSGVRTPRSLAPTNSRLVIDTILVGLRTPKIQGHPHSGTLVAKINHSFAPSSIQPFNKIITFFESPLRKFSMPHDDALVLTLEVGKHLMK